MKLKNTLWGILIPVLFIACGGNKQGDNAAQTAQPREYPTIVVQKQTATLQTTYPVTIRGQEDIEIRPRIDGFIDAIYVDEGSVVTKGQRLFQINSPQTEQAVTTARAAITTAEAQLNTAKLDVDRMRPLAERGIISDVQIRAYENTYESAVATLQQAQAGLTNALASQSWLSVTSPVDGVVGTIPYRQGSLVNNTHVLTTVSSIGNVYAYFSMNEKAMKELFDGLEGKNQSEKIKNIPEVTLTLADGTVYPEKGAVETVSGVVNVTTGSVNFRAKFPNKQGILRSGASGNISIPQTLDNVFVIPQKTTFALQDKTLVYKVQSDSVVQKIISVISTPDGQNYVVTNGLNEGDRIVSDGVTTLTNGAKIRYSNYNQ